MENQPSDQPLTEAELELEQLFHTDEEDDPSFHAIVESFQLSKEGFTTAFEEGVRKGGLLPDAVKDSANEWLEISADNYAALVSAYDDEARYEIGARLLNESLCELAEIAASHGVSCATPIIDIEKLTLVLTLNMERTSEANVPRSLMSTYESSLASYAQELFNRS